MPAIYPSVVRSFIESSFAKLLSDPAQAQGSLQINGRNISLVVGLLALIDQVPGHLLIFQGQQFLNWTIALESIRFALKRASASELVHNSIYVTAYSSNPIVALHGAISKCPDELPSPDIAGLEFVDDPVQRADLRLDIGRVRESFTRGDWKSATVLAGAVIEALLLWGILKRGEDKWQDAANHSRIQRWVKDRKNPEHWFLDDYLKVVIELDLVSAETLDQCRLAQNFRNLIHPGKSQRRELKCDRATALSAEAGMEHAIRDLIVRFTLERN